MQKKVILSLVLLCCVNSFSNPMPKWLKVVFKERLACRQARRFLRKSRIYVQCDEKARASRAWSAVYVGEEPLDTVLSEITQYSRISDAQASG